MAPCRVKARKDSTMDDEHAVKLPGRDDETPLAVLLGGRIVDEALRGIRFHPPATEFQYKDPRGRKREDRGFGLVSRS